MILTNKAKEDFGKFLVLNHKIASWDDFTSKPLTCQNALIIEWLDSVGIYIGVYPNNNMSSYLSFEMSINDDWTGEELTRQEATIQAITKANDIYNERFK